MKTSKINKKFCMASVIFLSMTVSAFFTRLPLTSALAGDYDWENEELIDSLIFFNREGVELGIPEEYIVYDYDALNGINALIPQSMFDYLQTADFVESIETNSKELIKPCEDTLISNVDDINAELAWGHEEDAVNIAPGALTGKA